MSEIVYTTATGEPPADEGRDYIPTRDELRRPYSLDLPPTAGELTRHIKVSPGILRELKRRGLKLSDCKILADNRVELP